MCAESGQMQENSRGLLGMLRVTALVAIVAGAAGSSGLMFLAGSRQRSLVLMALFTGWVLSPFAALAWAGMVSTRWPALTRATLYGGMLVLTVASLLMYGGKVPMPPGSRPAAVFLVVPLASWVLMTLGAIVSAGLSRRGAGA